MNIYEKQAKIILGWPIFSKCGKERDLHAKEFIAKLKNNFLQPPTETFAAPYVRLFFFLVVAGKCRRVCWVECKHMKIVLWGALEKGLLEKIL